MLPGDRDTGPEAATGDNGTMKLGILRTDTVRPEWARSYGEYPDMFEALLGGLDPSLTFATWHVEAGEFPAGVDDADAWLVTGSKFSVYEDLPWIHRLLAFIRELHEAGKPLVGICFGHQAVAQALGGEVRKSAKGWGVGLHRHAFREEPPWFDGGDRSFRVLVSHQDQVERPAPGTAVLAGSDFCENAVCQVGEHILTFQGHPEFVPGYADYADREDALPLDAHYLLALIAPRSVLLGNSWRDVWSDPAGAWRAAEAASPVWSLYDVEGLNQTRLDEIDVSGHIAYHIRPATHGVRGEDWDAFLAFLDAQLQTRSGPEP